MIHITSKLNTDYVAVLCNNYQHGDTIVNIDPTHKSEVETGRAESDCIDCCIQVGVIHKRIQLRTIQAEDQRDIALLPIERVAPIMVLVTEQQQKDIDNLVTRSILPCTFTDGDKTTCLHCQAELTLSVIEGDPPDTFLLSSHDQACCEVLSANRLKSFAKGVSTGEDALSCAEAILHWLQNEEPEFVVDAFHSACVLRVAELKRQEKNYSNGHTRTKLEAVQKMLKRIIEDIEGL